MQEEERVPGLRSIEEVNLKFDEKGMFFRDYDDDYHQKRLGYFTMFPNIDLDDVIIPRSKQEID